MEMKTSLAKIVQQKQQTKNQLSNLKNRYLAIIYGGLSNQESVKAIHKRLYEETINQKKRGKATSGQMLNVAFGSVKELKKRTENVAFIKGQIKQKYGIEDVPISAIMGAYVFDLLKKKNTERKMSKVILSEADETEAESKEKAIKDMLYHNLRQSKEELKRTSDVEEIDTNKILIFYLASAHKDSASDHAPYQGKVYVDENWEKVEMPYELHQAISYYIKTHDVKTIQWVTGKPVWFITRPNCRHYFKEVSVKEVLKMSPKRMIKKYDLKTAIGDRQYLQTINHSTSKEWYEEVRNAQLLLKSYRERLELHKLMYEENPCQNLQSAITKDKMLIKKWEKYIASKEKIQ